MNDNIGTAAQLTLAQHAGDLSAGIYTTFAPPIVLATLAVLALCVGLLILARVGEYIIAWIFFRNDDDEQKDNHWQA